MQITVNGIELFFDVDGPLMAVDGGRLRERPTVLALHGGPGFDHGYLKTAGPALTGHAQVVYLDQRCQGRSAGPPVETCTLEQMADDAAALCERLGIRRPIVLGHSAGGFVALTMAIRHPGLAAGLVLCSTAPTLAATGASPAGPTMLERDGGPEAVAAAARVFGGDASGEAMTAFVHLVGPLYFHPDRRDLLAEVFGLSTFTPEVCGHFFGRLAQRYDVRPALGTIGIPALVLVGDSDWVCPPAAARAIAAGMPDARLVEIRDCGHFPFAERPDAFRTAVARFLEALAAPDPAAAAV